MLPSDIVDLLAKRLGSGANLKGINDRTQGVPVGNVRLCHGATVMRSSTIAPLSNGDPIFNNDVIETDSNGEIGVALSDQTVFILQKSSRIAIEGFQFDESRPGNGSIYYIIGGSAAFVAGKIAKSGDMQIATPVATLVIHGATGKGVIKVEFDVRDRGVTPQTKIDIYPNLTAVLVASTFFHWREILSAL